MSLTSYFFPDLEYRKVSGEYARVRRQHVGACRGRSVYIASSGYDGRFAKLTSLYKAYTSSRTFKNKRALAREIDTCKTELPGIIKALVDGDGTWSPPARRSTKRFLLLLLLVTIAIAVTLTGVGGLLVAAFGVAKAGLLASLFTAVKAGLLKFGLAALTQSSSFILSTVGGWFSFAGLRQLFKPGTLHKYNPFRFLKKFVASTKSSYPYAQPVLPALTRKKPLLNVFFPFLAHRGKKTFTKKLVKWLVNPVRWLMSFTKLCREGIDRSSSYIGTVWKTGREAYKTHHNSPSRGRANSGFMHQLYKQDSSRVVKPLFEIPLIILRPLKVIIDSIVDFVFAPFEFRDYLRSAPSPELVKAKSPQQQQRRSHEGEGYAYMAPQLRGQGRGRASQSGEIRVPPRAARRSRRLFDEGSRRSAGGDDARSLGRVVKDRMDGAEFSPKRRRR